jgi:hypothetical protein
VEWKQDSGKQLRRSDSFVAGYGILRHEGWNARYKRIKAVDLGAEIWLESKG